jgi:FtsP/CotA-like multicopper oxidase with cupredoxin domain
LRGAKNGGSIERGSKSFAAIAAFRVISRNGKTNALRERLDTAMLSPRETAEIAFFADNPGDWMFHCHVLEHQAGGMMACIRVA